MFHTLFKILQFIFLTLDFLLICTFTFFCSFLPGFITKHFMARLFSRWCWSLIRFLGVECHIHQKFQPPLPKHFLLISNHPSGMDILALNAIFAVAPLAKEEIKSWWIVGRIARAIGSVFVKREDKNSRHAAKQTLIQVLQQGKNLLIYPEGGCYGRHLRPFKLGSFEISIMSKVPILPVYMQYEAENDMEWGDYGLIRHLYNIRRACNKHVHCYIFDPVSPENFTDPQSYMEHVHKLYEQWEKKYRLP